MALEKKDTKIYLDPSVHAVFAEIAQARGLTLSQLASSVVQRYVVDQAHAATVIADAAKRAGIDRVAAGTAWESAGMAGSAQE
ncbi:MAG: hypothetical protein LW854_21330 [Rubrivivax sp.]|nr:hypothetical protein [Rubrivivax sp.]